MKNITNGSSAAGGAKRPKKSGLSRGGQWANGNEENGEVLIMIGPAIPIITRQRKCMSNAGGQPEVEQVKLTAAMHTASLIFEDDRTSTSGSALANEGFDPNQARVPSGRPAGGQWTSGSQNESGSLGMAPSTTVTSGGNTILPDQFGKLQEDDKTNGGSARTQLSITPESQPTVVQSKGTGEGTKAQLENARQTLDAAYVREISDIKGMRGISDE